MLRKSFVCFVLSASILVAGCHHSKVQNPIANIDSKQPDKVLFDRAMDAMKHSKYSVARTLLETLINTYPESEYVARAKLAVGDSWYAEGGTASLQQAEAQYKDFITFFPNMPEAAEAQLKVANIHYKEMEKPDRDFTQAMRAADEYKALIQQFPDSKLVPEAKQRLREVQEVLAERQSRIAHFYYLRNNLAAAQARLISLINSYPLYSSVDEAMFSLGSIYEKEANNMRMQRNLPEILRAKLAGEYDQKAVDTYSRLITRYPAMNRADDARRRLAVMKAPIPTPTPEALAQSQAEEVSREESGRIHSLIGNFRKHPDVAKSAKTGEPNLEEEEINSAPALLKQLDAELKSGAAGSGTQQVAIEKVKAGTGTPGASQAPPSSQNNQSSQSNQQAASTNNPPATPPTRTNDVGSSSDTGTQALTDTQDGGNNQQDSSSKKKGKKGLHKLIPF
jgi:outer membrane protein assembly factor BamD